MQAADASTASPTVGKGRSHRAGQHLGRGFKWGEREQVVNERRRTACAVARLVGRVANDLVRGLAARRIVQEEASVHANVRRAQRFAENRVAFLPTAPGAALSHAVPAAITNFNSSPHSHPCLQCPAAGHLRVYARREPISLIRGILAR